MAADTPSRPPVAAFVAAFAVVYLAYGLNYLAIREGVKTLPPFLFAGAQVTTAGMLLFAWLVVTREPFVLTWHGFLWAVIGGVIVFIGGTGLVTVGERSVDSGLASMLRSTTPIWVALLEWLRPKGERLNAWGWLGLFVAIGGVLLLVIPRLEAARTLDQAEGPLLVLASAFSWAVGALVLRHRRPCPSVLVATAYQMTAGGVGMLALGVSLGEASEFRAADITDDAVFAYLFLVLVHSLLGFSCLNWLLKHVSAPLAMTKFFVSPAVAIVAGYWVLGEKVTPVMLGGMILILAGVGLAIARR